MDREYEELLPRRALGEGHWDRRLKDRMVNLSVADNYDDCKHEWIVTENVWYIPFGEDANVVLPDIHCHGENAHVHECLCGHPIVWHFEIENTENGNKEIVGSEHIESYMVIRYFEKKGYAPEAVTEEMIEQWIQERVKALKAQWWWDMHGEQFTEWFEAVRELDLRVNQRRKGSVWDNETHRHEPQYVIRKRSEGKFGQSGYKMASLVWRWNHPNNSRRQIETRGYPNERLWNDLQIFYITQQQYRMEIEAVNRERGQRLEQLAENRRLEGERQRQRQEEYRRNQILRTQRLEAQKMKDAEVEGLQEKKRLANLMKSRVDAEVAENNFTEMCEFYDVPVFTRDNGANDWERKFLTDLIMRMGQGKTLSENQLHHLRNIVIDEPLPATDKQKWYIKKLAGDDFEMPEGLNRVTASELISMLKEEE